jgi:hypothetical protein
LLPGGMAPLIVASTCISTAQSAASVTVKHIHQQVNVTQGGQAVVAGDKVTSRARGRRGSDGGGWSKMSDEPRVREREPIERVRARLEALAMANAAPRCGARSKRTGKPCRTAAMPNGRCKVHGGKSTGPRTPEGLERSRRANWKHGYYSREAKAERSRVRAAILALRYLRMFGH